MSGFSFACLSDLTTSPINRESLFYQVHSISTRTKVYSICFICIYTVASSTTTTISTQTDWNQRNREVAILFLGSYSYWFSFAPENNKTYIPTRLVALLSAKPLPGWCCYKKLISSVAIYTYFYSHVIYNHSYAYTYTYLIWLLYVHCWTHLHNIFIHGYKAQAIVMNK